MKQFVFFIFLSSLFLLVACGSEPEIEVVGEMVAETAASTPVNTAVATNTATATTESTATITSTPSPIPATSTPIPTKTATPSPTTTPSPTVTALPSATPQPIATAQPATTPLNDIASRMGEEVTVLGQITAVSSFSGGYTFTLNDGNGTIALLMWNNVYDDCWDAPELNIGATVKATGEIGEYEGNLQLTPNFGGDVKVTSAGSATAPHSPIGELGGHIDERVTVTGAVLRVEGAGSGTKIFIADDTGEILIFIWGNTLDRVPQNTALGVAGTQVRVTGVVEIYRSNREIVPVLPYDVVVLE